MKPHRPVPPRLAATAATLALTLGLAACGGSGGSDGGAVDVGDAATAEQTTTTAEATTTAAPTTAPPPVGTPSPGESAQKLYDAWKADDRAAAATVAGAEVVEKMWLTAAGDYSQYSGCDSGEFGTSGCLYRGANGTIQFTMEREGDAWIVTEVFYAEP